jgi:hypothetical protein
VPNTDLNSGLQNIYSQIKNLGSLNQLPFPVIATFQLATQGQIVGASTGIIANRRENRPQPSVAGMRPRSFLAMLTLCASLLFALHPNAALAQLTADSPATGIQFIIKTGGDDLRGDSEATAEIFSVDGQPLQNVTLKAQKDSSWHNNSTHTVLANLDQQLSANQIGEIAISLVEHNSFPETDDNWNIQAVTVNLVTAFGGSFSLIMDRNGLPLVRLTGSKPTVTIGTAAGNIYPKYQIYALIYAIPGCTNSTTYKCPSTGLIDYGSQSSLGTQVSISSSLGGGFSATVGTAGSSGGQSAGGSSGSAGGSSGSAGGSSGGAGGSSGGAGGSSGGGLSGSVAFNASSSGTSTVTITKTQTSDLKLAGNEDGLSHDQDIFIILLNPLVSIRASALQGSSAGTVIGWTPTYAPPTPELVYLSVAELKDPSKMYPAKLSQLKALGFTTTDFQEILMQDPLASLEPYLDPKRYAYVAFSFPYTPPTQNSQNCNGGTCSCVANLQGLSNIVQDQSISSSSTSLSVSAKVPILKYVSFGPSFTWTNSSTKINILSGSQTATVSMACPSPGYTSPLDNVDVYWDTIYGSFVFVMDELGNLSQISSGTLTDPAGRPQTGVLVELKVANRVYKTLTNSRGQYHFHVASTAIAAKLPSLGQITARGVTKSVTLRSATPTQMQIPFAKPQILRSLP